jgi:hypothetical protein
MKDRKKMTAKPIFKDETRIGEIAAQQPLSGLRIVSAMSVKGFNGPTFVVIEGKDTKKSA